MALISRWPASGPDTYWRPEPRDVISAGLRFDAQSASGTWDPNLNHDPTVALFWFAGAAIFGGIAIVAAYGHWLRTGRPW